MRMNEFFVVYGAEIARKLKSKPFQIGLLIGILGIYGFIELPQWIAGATASIRTHVLTADPSLIERVKPLLEHDFKIAATVTGMGTPAADQVNAHKGATWVLLSHGAQGLQITMYSENPGNVAKIRIVDDLVPLNIELATHASRLQAASLLAIPVTIEGLGTSRFSSEHAADASQTIAFTLLFFLYLLITFNSQLLMSSVAEEKTSRI